MVEASKVISKAAMASTVVLVLAPMFTMREIRKNKGTGNMSSFPYVASVLNGACWVLFSYLEDLMEMRISNFAVAIFNFAVLVSFLGWEGTKERSNVFGIFGIVANVAMFASPLSVMQSVIRMKDASSLPKALSFGCLLASVLWSLYGFSIMKLPIIVPNVLGFVCALLQVFLIFHYRHPTNYDKERDAQKTPLGP